MNRATTFISSVLSLQYSREDEKDADMTGLSYMTQAGYDPNGIVETMRILEELQTHRPIEFFSTHPNPESRIAYLEDRIARRYADLSGLEGRQGRIRGEDPDAAGPTEREGTHQDAAPGAVGNKEKPAS